MAVWYINIVCVVQFLHVTSDYKITFVGCHGVVIALTCTLGHNQAPFFVISVVFFHTPKSQRMVLGACTGDETCLYSILYVEILFVKACKIVSIAISLVPLTGCAIGVGLIFAGLLRAEAYTPEWGAVLFGRAMLGFALVESFMVVIIGTIMLIIVY